MFSWQRIFFSVIIIIFLLAAVNTALAQGPDNPLDQAGAEIGTVEERLPENGIQWGPGCSAGSVIYYQITDPPTGKVKGASMGHCASPIKHMWVKGTLFIGGSKVWSDDRGGWVRKNIRVASGWVQISNRPVRVKENGQHKFDDVIHGVWRPETSVSMTY